MENRKGTVFITCLILSLFFYPAGAIDISPGTAAPEFSLPSLDGRTVSLHSYKDSVVVLIYWWPGQPRSLLALKDGQDMVRRFKDRDVQVIGLTASTDHTGAVKRILKNNNIDFPVLSDSERQVFGEYGIHVYPSTVVIDKKGQVAYTLAGHALTYKQRLEGHIQYILGEIDEEAMHHMVSPRNEYTEESLLIAHSEYNMALKLTEERLFDLAIDAARRSINVRADIAEPHILLGFLYLERNESDKAFSEFNEAIKLSPDAHDAKTGLGGALILSGDIDRAIEVLSDAASGNPNPEMTYYELGRAYELKDEKDKAIQMYKKALQNNIHMNLIPSSVSRCR